MCTYKVQNVSHISACSKPKLQSVSASPSAFIRRAPEHSYFFYGGRLRRMAIKNIHSLRWWSARRRELMHPGKQGGANSLTLQASLSRCTKAGDIVSHLCNREPTIRRPKWRACSPQRCASPLTFWSFVVHCQCWTWLQSFHCVGIRTTSSRCAWRLQMRFCFRQVGHVLLVENTELQCHGKEIFKLLYLNIWIVLSLDWHSSSPIL